MKCPHCLVSIHSGFQHFGSVDYQGMVRDGKSLLARSLRAYQQVCPECKEIMVELEIILQGVNAKRFLTYPEAPIRPIPPEVVDPYANDFREASRVLADSAKASAALSRRCLQAVLRDKGQTKSKDLADQIDELVNAGTVPGYVAEGLHALRNIGNFGAHPMKSKNTGEIVDVEPGEAEWNLDVLESVFDFYFVQPALTARRKAELNKKLKEAGKPELT